MNSSDTNSRDMSAFINDFDDWVCGICREGDAGDGLRTLHECKRHEFHTVCLARWRARDVRCPICRFPVDAMPPSSQSSSEEEPTLPSLLHLRLPFQTGMQYAVARYGNMFQQLMPNHSTAPRFRPRVGKAFGEGHYCGYCTHPIDEVSHTFLYTCFHHMHTLCIIDNMYQNGVSEQTANLFCPRCYRTTGRIH